MPHTIQPVKLQLLLLSMMTAAVAGCSGRPGRVDTPDVDAEAAAELALQEYDRNGNSSLSKEELAASPPLLDALPTYDTDRDGALASSEIIAGINSWAQRGVGAIPLPFTVRLDGRPLPDAQIKLVPAPFLEDAVKPASGIADGSGSGMFNMAPEDRPPNVPKNLAVVQPGLYRVEITHPSVAVPSKYNSASTLGLEAGIAGQNPAGVTWELTSK